MYEKTVANHSSGATRTTMLEGMPRWTPLLAIALLAACGDHVSQALAGRTAASSTVAPSATHAMSVTPVPWISAAPSYPTAAAPTPAPIPVGVARCDPRTLRLDGGVHQLTMGHTYGFVVIIHDGPTCLVTGDVTLRFFDDRGVARLSASSQPSSLSKQYPGWAVAGSARVYWDGDWCDGLHPIVAIEMTYEGITQRSPLDAWTRGWGCDPAGVGAVGPSGANVWPIAPEPTTASKPTRAPDPALTATLSVPPHARAGERLDFLVTLTNRSDAVVRFEPCPNYGVYLNEELSPADPRAPKPGRAAFRVAAQARHALNCRAIPPLSPRETIQLAMRLDVPTDASGSLVVRWMLDEPNASIATAPVFVEARSTLRGGAVEDLFADAERTP